MARQRDDSQFNAADLGRLFDSFQRLDPRVQWVVVALLVLAGIVFAVAYIEMQRRPSTGGAASSTTSIQMLLGNPSDATDNPTNRDNFLLVKPYFALSYNSSAGTPNWVSWQVTTADLGAAPRKQEFDTDTTLPPGFTQVVTHDYSGSGFDRGHMCPHSDRAGNQEMSFATFVMTNIIPQAPNVNRKAWEQLESYGRELVSRNHVHLYVTAGPAGRGGTGSKGFAQSIGHGTVTVPAECWKIIVVVPGDADQNDLAALSADDRVISVIMPNDQTQVGEEWDRFRTSTAEVERHTGFHFFTNVSPEVANVWRQKVDDEPIPAPRPHGHYSE